MSNTHFNLHFNARVPDSVAAAATELADTLAAVIYTPANPEPIAKQGFDTGRARTLIGDLERTLNQLFS